MITSLTYDKIKEAYSSKGYSFYDVGDYNLNIGFIRESDEFTNAFTDTFFIAYREMAIKRCYTAPATTKAGISKALLTPKVIAGMKGVAVVVPGQYSGAWQFVDSYTGWLKYPYFQQIKPIDIWRDPNGDTKIDKDQKQNGIFGINIHRMSNVGFMGGILANWSEGCMGSSEPELKKSLPIIRDSVKKYGSIFTVTLLESKDLK